MLPCATVHDSDDADRFVVCAALAFGTALSKALGDRKGIHRFGNFSAPLDEALVNCVLVSLVGLKLQCPLSADSILSDVQDLSAVSCSFMAPGINETVDIMTVKVCARWCSALGYPCGHICRAGICFHHM